MIHSHCENRATLGIHNRHGCFAEYLTLPIENLHPIPDQVSDQAAVFTEPLAAALQIQQQIHIKPTDKVLIVGAGRLGQLIAQTLSLSGCDLHVVVRHAYQRKILAERGIKTQQKLILLNEPTISLSKRPALQEGLIWREGLSVRAAL